MKKEIIEVIVSTAVPDLPSPADEKRDTTHKSVLYPWIYKTA